MRIATLATLGLFMTTILLAGQAPQTADVPSPFGLKMGMPKAQIGIEKEVAPFKFQLASVSKAHPDLATYVATVTPKAGLCFVRALSPTLKTSEDGAQLRSRFEEMKSQVEGIYGTPHLEDSLQSGSILDKARDWMTALLQKERTLQARWSGPDDNLPMKPTISKIYVGVFAVTKDSGYLAVEYYFSNYDQCQSEIQASQ